MSNETDIEKMVSLKRVAGYVLDELQLSPEQEDRVWLLLFRALVELGYDVAYEPITVALPLLPNFTFEFPTDCVAWSKIGIMDENGTISTLKINTALMKVHSSNPDRLNYIQPQVRDQLPTMVGAPYFFNYFYNGIYTHLFGTGSGLVQYGECSVDEVARVIIVPPTFQYDHVFLEYLSSPKKNGDYQMPIVFQEAAIAFAKWKMRKGPREEYYAAVIAGRRRMPKKRVTLQRLNQVLREFGGMYIHS